MRRYVVSAAAASPSRSCSWPSRSSALPALGSSASATACSPGAPSSSLPSLSSASARLELRRAPVGTARVDLVEQRDRAREYSRAVQPHQARLERTDRAAAAHVDQRIERAGRARLVGVVDDDRAEALGRQGVLAERARHVAVVNSISAL